MLIWGANHTRFIEDMIDITSPTEVEYNDRRFKQVSCLGEEIIAKEFNDCLFTNCTFRETSFKNCTFRDCRFAGTDLSLTQVQNCVFISTEFETCQMIGVNWTEANWNERGFLKTVSFTKCVIDYSTFFGLDLKDVSFVECRAKEVDFGEADLTQADCRQTDFLDSRFHHTNLTGADLRGAINYAIAPQSNTLKDTKFSLPEAMSLLYGLDIILEE